MYNYKQTKEHIRYFAISENNILYNTFNEVCSIANDNVLLFSKVKLQEIKYNKRYYINDSYGEGYYFSDELVPLKIGGYIDTLVKDYLIYSREDGEEESTVFRNLITGEEFVIPSSSMLIYCNDDYYIRRNYKKNIIESFSLLKFLELWQFDLSQFGQWYLDTDDARNYEVSKFLGTYKDALLIVCNSGRLVSLNIHTGELLHYWDAYPMIRESKHNGFNESMELDLERCEVVGMGHDVLWRVDLDTNIVYSYSLAEKFGQYDYEYITGMSSFPITENHYYLVLNTKYIERIDDRQQGIVALNKDTLEIDWHYLFDEGEWISSRKMQVTNTHLYLLDNNNNLYIFEKE